MSSLSCDGETVSQPTVQVSRPSPSRLLSLDVLRGITVAVMILVNNAGDGAVWNGCTLTDLVFPLFLFIVGASVTLSFSGRLARGASRSAIALQLLRRSISIFAAGLLLNALPYFDLHQLRIYGVLQRIAICYALAGLLYLYGRSLGCIVAVPLLLAGYSYVLLHVRVPGLGMPGVDIPALDPVANLPAWLDRQLLSPAHLYRHTVYDPEGLLSTVGALATTLLGLLAAVWLKTTVPLRRKAFLLALAGMLCINGGLLWSYSLPLNKRMYTSSFALVTAGIAMDLLALLYFTIDGPPRWRRGLTPWLVFGTNALTAYVFSEVLAIALAFKPAGSQHTLQRSLYGLLPGWLGPPSCVSMMYSILYVAVCFVPVYALYRRRIFLKF
jgi:predicted acyltransferase